jgi:aspartate/tyrosine/aromatic aminotransferase
MFSHVSAIPPDPLFGINDAYNQDKDPNKLNLGVGAYRDENGKPWVLPIVTEVKSTTFKTSNTKCLSNYIALM